MQMSFCYPNVTGLLLFHAFDETALDRFQSGLYYPDGTPKSSLAVVRDAARDVRGGVIAKCSGPRAVAEREGDVPADRGRSRPERRRWASPATSTARSSRGSRSCPAHTTTLSVRAERPGRREGGRHVPDAEDRAGPLPLHAFALCPREPRASRGRFASGPLVLR